MKRKWQTDPSINPVAQNDVLAKLLTGNWRTYKIQVIVRTPPAAYPAAANPLFDDSPGWGVIYDD